MPHTPSIKAELIEALKSLSGLQDNKKFKRLLGLLESPDVIIPENKYALDLLKLAYFLVSEYPEILTDPNNKPLKKMCKNALDELVSQPKTEYEPTTKPTRKS